MHGLEHLKKKNMDSCTECGETYDKNKLQEIKENGIEGLKQEINELLFKRLPGSTTLNQMETIACAIYKIIRDEWERVSI